MAFNFTTGEQSITGSITGSVNSVLAFPKGYIYGLEMAWGSTGSIEIAVGQCRDDGDEINMVTTGSLSIDIANTGINGIDVAQTIEDVWYYAFLIGKSDGTVGGTLSTSSTSPSLPTGYTFKRLLGATINNTGSFIPFVQTTKGSIRRFMYNIPAGLAPLNVVDNSITNTSWRSQALSGGIPPIATEQSLIFSLNQGGSTQEVYFLPNGAPEDGIGHHLIAVGGGQFVRSYHEMRVGTSQIVRVKTSATTVSTFDTTVRGWSFDA